MATPTAPVIHHYQHAESGGIHGFTHPLHPEIKKQVRAGQLTRVADQHGTDPDTEIAKLRAMVAQLAKASGIDPSSLDAGGLADTAAPSDETLDDVGQEDEDDGAEFATDADEDAADEAEHLCLECGEPVERKGKTGPWPSRHPECK